ncbi:MAG: hypothetical protein EB101_08565 [Chitinophagia bacterium]|nr:hypothetical protein [Chitinophagia bacterium]
MKQNKMLAATLLLLTGMGFNAMAQSPNIQKELRLVNPASGSGYVGLKAAPGTSTYTLSMPAAAPSANQVLTVSSISGGSVSLTWNSPDASGWSLSGNAGTSSSTFLGTLDGQPLVFKTNNSTRLSIGSAGDVSVNALAGATGTASATTNEGVVIADNNGQLSKASYASLVSAGLLASTSGVTVGGPLTVNGLFTANNGGTISGTLNLTGSSPLQLNGAAGTAGQILQSNGPGAAPTWSSAFIKARGLGTASNTESLSISESSIDGNDAISVTLEGTGADMPIPSYYVARTAGTGFTIYFSAPFTGSCNWSIINQ